MQGAVLTHVDDFSLAGTEKFIKDVIAGVEKTLTVSKVERDKFRFTGLDVCGEVGRISVSMDDYVNSLKGDREHQEG